MRTGCGGGRPLGDRLSERLAVDARGDGDDRALHMARFGTRCRPRAAGPYAQVLVSATAARNSCVINSTGRAGREPHPTRPTPSTPSFAVNADEPRGVVRGLTRPGDRPGIREARSLRIARRGTPHGSRLGKTRWVVKRTFACSTSSNACTSATRNTPTSTRTPRTRLPDCLLETTGHRILKRSVRRTGRACRPPSATPCRPAESCSRWQTRLMTAAS